MEIGDKIIDLKYGSKVIVDEIILEASKRIKGRFVCEAELAKLTEPKKTVKKKVKKLGIEKAEELVEKIEKETK